MGEPSRPSAAPVPSRRGRWPFHNRKITSSNVGVVGQGVDVVAAIAQNAFVAVDEADFGFSGYDAFQTRSRCRCQEPSLSYSILRPPRRDRHLMPLAPGRTARVRGKADGQVVSLDPELLLPAFAGVHRQDHARPAGAAPRGVKQLAGRVRTLRSPVFHEVLERIVPAGLGVRTAPQRVGRLVVLLCQQVEKFSGPLAPPGGSSGKIYVESASEVSRYSQTHHNCANDHQPAGALLPLLLACAVVCEIAGHALRLQDPLLRRRDTLCYTPPAPQR